MEYSKDSSILQFPVVGIGASAGGLEAFKLFLKEIPERSGMAYIFVLHLNSEKISALTEILSKVSKIPVLEIENDLSIKMDHAYVIPPHSMLTTEDAKLVLRPRNDIKKIKVIDLFFSSLGIVHESFAIGVILSGALNDGTLGLNVIKASGGITFAQDQTAIFESMPQSAIDNSAVDYILPPDLIAKKILEINQPFTGLSANEDKETVYLLDDNAYSNILTLIKKKTQTDFHNYKPSTIKRRIIRRMAFSKIYIPEEYFDFLQKNEDEIRLLYKDLMISVTSFFRDPKSFEDLKEIVFPSLLKNKSDYDTFRIWAAGCASGEEAYSIAICLHEYLGSRNTNLKIQIFATDISEDAIFKARHGIYTKVELDSVSPTRLQQYFIKLDGNYQIKKFIRDQCVFASHNMLVDPPFSRIDLIACRNVMIYFNTTLQKHILNTFHYSLLDKGFLMLGKSETANAASNLFVLKSKNEKIYAKKGGSSKTHFNNESIKSLYSGIKPHSSEPIPTIFNHADTILLNSYAPASVLINEHCDILQFRGNLDMWLAPSSGKASLNLLKMAREGLAFELRSLINEAKRSKNAVHKKSFSLRLKEEIRPVEVEIVRIEHTELHFLLVFTEVRTELNSPASKKTILSDKDVHIEVLENELSHVRDKMKSISEDQEAVNEELQSANEELRSSNEELQTVNEELETSKEELLSTNEEIAIINSEMRDRNQQLNKLQKFTEAVLNTVREPLLMLTHDLQIRRATDGFYKMFGLKESDIENKCIFDLEEKNWDIPELRQLLEKSIQGNTEVNEIEFSHDFLKAGYRNLLVNIRPIEKNGGRQILLAFEDITDKRKIEKYIDDLRLSNDDLQQFANIASHDMQEPIRKIITFANLIKNNTFSKKNEPEIYLNKIEAAAKRLQNLVTDILNYSKISDKTGLFEKTDLNKILENSLADFEIIIQEKKAIIKKGKLENIEVIPLQINQLFHNLLGNALKFTNLTATPVIEIYSKTLSQKELNLIPQLNQNLKYTVISFTDNGIGIEEQHYEKIFLMFQRLNSKENYKGTGIGLALCKKIALNHSGDITVSSIPGTTTTFKVYLPKKQTYKM